jgi:cytoskeleton protein RodZ
VEGKESAAAAGTTGVATAEPGGGAAATAASGALVLAFRGTSWAEVKDANGRVILQMTGGAGMTQTVSGTPPYELALGNAPEVTVTFRGQSLDLTPYTRGGVARVALK